jgi:hypothetical protein
MKPKKEEKRTVHDLRDISSVRVAVPDVAGELAGAVPLAGSKGPRIVTPGVGVQTPGQTTHE